jgi:hypothetical protein
MEDSSAAQAATGESAQAAAGVSNNAVLVQAHEFKSQALPVFKGNAASARKLGQAVRQLMQNHQGLEIMDDAGTGKFPSPNAEGHIAYADGMSQNPLARRVGLLNQHLWAMLTKSIEPDFPQVMKMLSRKQSNGSGAHAIIRLIAAFPQNTANTVHDAANRMKLEGMASAEKPTERRTRIGTKTNC